MKYENLWSPFIHPPLPNVNANVDSAEHVQINFKGSNTVESATGQGSNIKESEEIMESGVGSFSFGNFGLSSSSSPPPHLSRNVKMRTNEFSASKWGSGWTLAYTRFAQG